MPSTVEASTGQPVEDVLVLFAELQVDEGTPPAVHVVSGRDIRGVRRSCALRPRPSS
jgi:hypothetical protein